ncbi:MAG: hypothetical protein ACREGD_04380 [Candidatus Saccharimonadales bacterium]
MSELRSEHASGWNLGGVDTAFVAAFNGEPLPEMHPFLEQTTIEAVARLQPQAIGQSPPRTKVGAEQLGQAISQYESPEAIPLPYMLLAADRLRRHERTVGELAVSASRLGVFPRARHESLLHSTLSQRVARRHGTGVRYIDNPNVEGDDRSLAAWMLAWSLERICADGQVLPGCEELAGTLTKQLLDVHQRRIIIGMGQKIERPDGIELLDLINLLADREGIGRAVQTFTENTQANQAARASKAEEALHIKHPTSEPTLRSRSALARSAHQYMQDCTRPASELAALADALPEEQTERLLSIANALRERRDAERPGSKERQVFAQFYQNLLINHGLELAEHTIKHAELLATDEASLHVALYLHDMLYGENPIQYGRRELEEALAASAAQWFRQRYPAVYTTVDDDRFQQRFAEMKGLPKASFTTMIRAYLYDATQIAGSLPKNGATRGLRKLRKQGLLEGVPGKRNPQRYVFMRGLPPAVKDILANV